MVQFEFRCKNCGKLLFKGEFKGVVEIKCKCGYINRIEKKIIVED